MYRLATTRCFENNDVWVNLGVLYAKGQGVPQDYQEARRLFRIAARMGNPKAQYHLGDMYANGQGMRQHYWNAARKYRRAAEQGYAPAQVHLGGLFAKGQGVQQNYVYAHKWYNLAAMQGNEEGRQFRDKVAKHMTPAELAEAQRHAREWKPKRRQ